MSKKHKPAPLVDLVTAAIDPEATPPTEAELVSADQAELEAAEHGLPEIAKRLGACFAAVLVDAFTELDFDEAQFTASAICLEAFILAHPTAPHGAALQQIKLKFGVQFFPELEPRRLQLILLLFRDVVLGLNVIAREDDEAELAQLNKAKAAAPVTPLREAERAMQEVKGDFSPIRQTGGG